jgi:hypothetical protein
MNFFRLHSSNKKGLPRAEDLCQTVQLTFTTVSVNKGIQAVLLTNTDDMRSQTIFEVPGKQP